MERIESSAKNQSSFLWHVRWREYGDQKFLEDAAARYEMMLKLMREHPTTFIVPTYDIDVIWHTHLAFPCRYLTDCHRIAGRAINHDDGVGHDRSPAGFLITSAARTEKLWAAAFSSAWRKEGAMHRGEPPPWFWSDRARAAAAPPAAPPPVSQAAGLFRNYVVQVVGRAFGALDSDEKVMPPFKWIARPPPRARPPARMHLPSNRTGLTREKGNLPLVGLSSVTRSSAKEKRWCPSQSRQQVQEMEMGESADVHFRPPARPPALLPLSSNQTRLRMALRGRRIAARARTTPLCRRRRPG
jgi:hypothetical protein